MSNLNQKLQDNYHSSHSSRASFSVYQNLSVQWPYFLNNYKDIFELNKNIQVLEIGAGSGSLLSLFINKGFKNVVGIDISSQEVQIAKEKNLPMYQANAIDFLKDKKESFDLIILKAVFEHLTIEEGDKLLQNIHDSLKVDGLVLIDVPNMDWLLANHERYMDLTHKVGYTRESLHQIMGLYFSEIKINASVEPITSFSSRIRIKIIKPCLLIFIKFVLRVLGEGASDFLFQSRSIIATGKKLKLN